MHDLKLPLFALDDSICGVWLLPRTRAYSICGGWWLPKTREETYTGSVLRLVSIFTNSSKKPFLSCVAQGIPASEAPYIIARFKVGEKPVEQSTGTSCRELLAGV